MKSQNLINLLTARFRRFNLRKKWASFSFFFTDTTDVISKLLFVFVVVIYYQLLPILLLFFVMFALVLFSYKYCEINALMRHSEVLAISNTVLPKISCYFTTLLPSHIPYYPPPPPQYFIRDSRHFDQDYC